MKITETKIENLREYENNPRNNDGAVGAVAASIRQFGFKVPIVIDKTGVIVCGHTRVKAAKRLGLTTVPAVIADDLTPEQIKAFRLADNKTAEISHWDNAALLKELEALKDIDMEQFGFAEMADAAKDWFDSRIRDDDSRQEGNDEYNEFLDKFEDPKTTDDCYTPDIVYDAVADFVQERYGKDRSTFVRPFYPGGDFENASYPEGCTVVDNPPFSIMRRIIDFYTERKISYFLFAPAVAAINYANDATAVCVGVNVTYENKANISTSFLTNMEPGIAAMCDADLYERVQKAADEYAAKFSNPMPKYEFPDCVATGAMLSKFSKYGQTLKIERDECKMIRELDAMKEIGKGIYGSGLLLSEKAAAEKAAAEKAAATVWQLSEREKEIQKNLGKK